MNRERERRTATKITEMWLRSSFKSPRCQHTLDASRLPQLLSCSRAFGRLVVMTGNTWQKETSFRLFDSRGTRGSRPAKSQSKPRQYFFIFVEPTIAKTYPPRLSACVWIRVQVHGKSDVSFFTEHGDALFFGNLNISNQDFSVGRQTILCA